MSGITRRLSELLEGNMGAVSDKRDKIWAEVFHCVSGVFFLCWIGWYFEPVMYMFALWVLYVKIHAILEADRA